MNSAETPPILDAEERDALFLESLTKPLDIRPTSPPTGAEPEMVALLMESDIVPLL